MLEIWTANIHYDPTCQDRVNITVKSGDKTFAPRWEMVMGHKNRTISDAEYTKLYVEMMKKSLKENQERWREILSRKRVVFVCYCEEGRFCHRILLAKIFEMLGGKYMGEITLRK